jgi:hypothetical protein
LMVLKIDIRAVTNGGIWWLSREIVTIMAWGEFLSKGRS